MTKMMEHIYNQVVAKADSFIKYYRDDLLKHDKKAIMESDGVSFLHFTGETGTHIVLFHSPNDYPAKGDRIPYLFGTADRDHILDGMVKVVDHMKKATRQDVILFWGQNNLDIKEINQDTAELLVRLYRDGIKTSWGAEADGETHWEKVSVSFDDAIKAMPEKV